MSAEAPAPPLVVEFPANFPIVRIAAALAHVGLTFDVDVATERLVVREAKPPE